MSNHAAFPKAIYFFIEPSLAAGVVAAKPYHFAKKRRKSLPLEGKVDWPKAKTDEVETLRALTLPVAPTKAPLVQRGVPRRGGGIGSVPCAPASRCPPKSLPCVRGGAPQGRRG